MPVIHIYSPKSKAPQGLLARLSNEILDELQLPPNHAWMLWHPVSPENAFKPGWEGDQPAPIVVMYCKSRYTEEQVVRVMNIVQKVLSEKCSCDPDEIFMTVQRVHPYHLLARGTIWKG
ncbi:hypothetical protein [Paludifilum halophilum]|nr:hypothetical protein [Paludifilum halophilum]